MVNGPLTIKVVSAAIVFCCVVYLAFVVGPAAETRYFPVLDKLRITDVTYAEDEGSAIVNAEFTKRRACEYVGMAWYKIRPDLALERVSLTLGRRDEDRSSPNRPVGVSVGGPWIVGMYPDQIRPFSVVEIFHRCHPFWTTRTEFYP